MKRVGDVEVEQDLTFERRSYRAQRIGQGLLAAFVLAAIAGFFGNGPFDRAKAADESGGLRVEYPRFTRRLTDWEMVVEVGPAAAQGREFQLWFDRSFAERFTLEGALPEPLDTAVDGDRVLLRFRREEDPAAARVRCVVRPLQSGRGEMQLGVVGGPAVTLRYFVYP